MRYIRHVQSVTSVRNKVMEEEMLFNVLREKRPLPSSSAGQRDLYVGTLHFANSSLTTDLKLICYHKNKLCSYGFWHAFVFCANVLFRENMCYCHCPFLCFSVDQITEESRKTCDFCAYEQ